MPATQTDRIDGLTTSVAVKAPCRVATIAAVVLLGLQTVDGIALADNDRVLVKSQTSAIDNGIYLAHSTAWERSLDFDGARDVVYGTIVYVRSGSAAGFWQAVSAADPIIIGLSSITFTGITAALASGAVLDATDFGAVPDGVTNNNTTILAAVARLQTNGGGHLVFPGPGAYNVLGKTDFTALFTLTNCNGVTIECMDGAYINDTQTYTGTQAGDLFDFVACNNTELKLRVTSQVAVTTSATNARGLWAASFLQGCKGINADLDITGCIGGLRPIKDAADPASYVSRHIRAKIRASGTYYPYNAKFSGDDAKIQIDSDTCGRSFYVYGVKGQDITVHCKNQQVTSIIGAFSGYGCDDFKLSFIDRDSDANKPAAPRVQLLWGDSTAAKHSNIDLHFNTLNPSASPWGGNTFEFVKISDGGSAADLTGRGHILDGFTMSGYMEDGGADVAHIGMSIGSFATPDVQRRIVSPGLTLKGALSQAVVWLNVLSDVATFQNVDSDGVINVPNGSSGNVIFDACSAKQMSASANDVHNYRNCNITTGTTQDYGINKTWDETKLPNGLYKNGRRSVSAENSRNGDLTGTNNLFKVAAIGSGVSGTIYYHLVADNTDFTAATRDITRGAKSFSATISGAGAWVSDLAFADEVTERTSGGTASVVTFSLVDGTSAGGFIAMACTNYSGANAVGDFRIELDGMSDLTAVNPA